MNTEVKILVGLAAFAVGYVVFRGGSASASSAADGPPPVGKSFEVLRYNGCYIALRAKDPPPPPIPGPGLAPLAWEVYVYKDVGLGNGLAGTRWKQASSSNAYDRQDAIYQGQALCDLIQAGKL